jgi:phytoene dehydrogenase-like protein
MGRAVIIGGGANGVASAVMLAANGHEVTLLEAKSEIGGRCALLADTTTIQPWAVTQLGLDVEWTDAPATKIVGAQVLRTILPDDENLLPWRKQVESFREIIVSLSTHAAPDIRKQGAVSTLLPAVVSGLKLGRARGMELARIGPLCAEDWLDEWNIDRATQAALILPALRGSWMGPRSPTSALAVLFHHALAGSAIKGGMTSLMAALKKRADGAGVTIQTDALVSKIKLTDGAVSGVELADGSTIETDLVVSTVGPQRTILELVDPRDVPGSVQQAIASFRSRGIVAHLECTLPEPLFRGAEHVVVADDTVMIERAFDDAKHRRLPSRPALEIFQSNGRAQILAFGAAYDLDGGWTDAARAQLQASIMAVLAEHTDGASIDDVVLRTPADLETEMGLAGGHLFHGEFALDQFLSFRPHPSMSNHESGIAGLRIGGCGTHPAGGFTLVQGVLAGR